MEGPAIPSGSQVRSCSYFFICYVNFFTSELSKFNKNVILTKPSKYMYYFFYRRFHAVVERRWRDPPFPAAARCVYVHIFFICYVNFFTSELSKFNKNVILTKQNKYMYYFFYRRLHAVDARCWRDPFTPACYQVLKKNTLSSPVAAVLIYVLKL